MADLFDYSRLEEVPKTEQFDLPRYDPPRGTSQRVKDIVGNKDVRAQMHAMLDAGEKMGGHKWYNADPLRDQFMRVLGSGGDKAFRKYMDLVAATSPRSNVLMNVRNASYYYSRIMHGRGAPEVGEKNPQPYGHMAQRLHQMNVKAVAGPGWDPLKNPKPASFVENLAGNQQPGTIDTHAFRLPAMLAKDPRFLETAYESSKTAPKRNIQQEVESGAMTIEEALGKGAHWQSMPNKNEYKELEGYYQGLGKERGRTAAQTQASAWVGGGKLTGLGSDESKPFLRFVEDRIHETAKHHDMDPEDVLHSFIRGDVTLRATGGRVGFREGGAVHVEPTDAQKVAGNYPKTHTSFKGIPIAIENPKGSIRRGRGWECKVPYHYGYIKRSEGADGSHVDVCIGPHEESDAVFIIDQRDADTMKFDEHKVLLGYRSREEAVGDYKKGFSDGRGHERLGPVTRLTIHELKQWLKNHDTTKAMRGNGHLDKALALVSNIGARR